MTAANLITAPALAQQTARNPLSGLSLPTARMTSFPPAVRVSDNLLQRNGFTNRLPAPNSRRVANPSLPQRPASDKPSKRFRGGGHTFGAARARYGAVRDLSRTRSRQYTALADFMAAIRYAVMVAMIEAIEALAKICRTVVTAITDPARLIAARSVTSIDTSPLVEAAKRKDAELLVKMPVSADCLKHAPVTFAAAPAAMPAEPRKWLSLSDTPGLPTTIETKGMGDLLASAKVLHPEWLTDGDRVKFGAKARA